MVTTHDAKDKAGRNDDGDELGEKKTQSVRVIDDRRHDRIADGHKKLLHAERKEESSAVPYERWQPAHHAQCPDDDRLHYLLASEWEADVN